MWKIEYQKILSLPQMHKTLQDIVFKLLGKRYLPFWVILLIDLTIVGIAFVFSVLLLSDFDFALLYNKDRLLTWSILELCFGVSFLLYKSYEGAFRHTGVRDLIRLVLAALTSISLAFFASRIASKYWVLDLSQFSVAFLILHGFSFTMGVLGLRLFVKLAYSRFVLNTTGRKEVGVLIYGAGTTGSTVRNAIKQDPHANSQVIGFIDDNPALIGKRIDGVKVFSFDEAFNSSFIKRHKVNRVVWSIQSKIESSFQRAGDACLNNNLIFQQVPNVNNWIDGQLSSKQLKSVRIEDLLNRAPISLENGGANHFIKGKTVLITGAAGSIGSEIVRQVYHYKPQKLVLLDNAETPMNQLILDLKRSRIDMQVVTAYMGDVTRKNRIDEVFQEVKPNVVFHAAAYKHVPLMEENAKEAVRVNVVGTEILAKASIEHEVEKFVMISTDKAVNPSNVMGASKRSAEILVQSLNKKSKTEFITTRFGNVLGSNGSVIPLFRKQIENREDVTVTHKDIVRYFMTIPEAVQLVLEAATMGNGGEIFVFDMGQPVKIYELAQKMIKLSGLEEGKDIRIVETGLRPGEKLYEELLSDAENTLPTHHPKIMIAQVREYDEASTQSVFEHLSYASLNGATDAELVKSMKQLIPEFKSLNSTYELLDG